MFCNTAINIKSFVINNKHNINAVLWISPLLQPLAIMAYSENHFYWLAVVSTSVPVIKDSTKYLFFLPFTKTLHLTHLREVHMSAITAFMCTISYSKIRFEWFHCNST